MTRLFLDNDLEGLKSFDLNEEDSRYISQVLRMKQGETLICVDKSGMENVCTVSSFSKKSVTVTVGERRANDSEAPIRVTLFQSVSKGERMDLTIQKATELGVHSIVPVLSERCVVRLDKDSKSKIERWQKIALEASRQSGRGKVPHIEMPVTFDEAVARIKDYDLTIFPWEEETNKGLKQALHEFNGNDIAVFIGPEGGYEVREAEEAEKSGALRVTLGKRILRTETAGAAVLAMIVYEKEI